MIPQRLFPTPLLFDTTEYLPSRMGYWNAWQVQARPQGLSRNFEYWIPLVLHSLLIKIKLTCMWIVGELPGHTDSSWGVDHYTPVELWLGGHGRGVIRIRQMFLSIQICEENEWLFSALHCGRCGRSRCLNTIFSRQSDMRGERSGLGGPLDKGWGR